MVKERHDIAVFISDLYPYRGDIVSRALNKFIRRDVEDQTQSGHCALCNRLNDFSVLNAVKSEPCCFAAPVADVFAEEHICIVELHLESRHCFDHGKLHLRRHILHAVNSREVQRVLDDLILPVCEAFLLLHLVTDVIVYQHRRRDEILIGGIFTGVFLYEHIVLIHPHAVAV